MVGFHATKGDGSHDEADPIVLPTHDRQTRAGRRRTLIVNTNHASAEVADMVRVPKPGPRYLHVPRHVGREFVRQLTSEEPVPRFDSSGIEVGVRWKLKGPGRRNEAFDCMRIALALFSTVKGGAWDRLETRRAIRNGAVEVAP